MSLDDFIKDKKSKRSCSSEFQTKKKKTAKSIVPDVTIKIGQKKIVNGEMKTVWGKRLPISVSRNATYAQILQKGIEKWTAVDRNFDSDNKDVLVYQDGSCAQFMPGSYKNFFDLEKYKTELGKDFKKITLYLCSGNDLELSKGLQSNCEDTSDHDQDCVEEITHHKDHTDIAVEEMQQIESDKKLAQIMQEELDRGNVTEVSPMSSEDIYKTMASTVDDDKQFFLVTRRKAQLTRKLFFGKGKLKRVHRHLG